MRKLFIAAALALLALPAAAADLALKAPPYVPVCTTAFCTGFYVGGGIDGNGTSADIIGSGLSGSVFGAGAVPSVQAGFQFWNGSIFFDGEVGLGYGVAAPSSVNGVGTTTTTGLIGYQELQLGGKLSGLFGGASAPIVTPTALLSDLIAPYVAVGVAEEKGATGLETGAGAKFVISPNALLDIGYRYIPFNATSGITTIKADNLIRVRFSYIFK